ncbi:MAG: hypothetical protein WC998_05315 [Candidatus Paceibacterota bacterium]|jgi:hypothetical protein
MIPMLCDEAIKVMIDSVDMKEEDKEYFLSSLPELDMEGKESLYNLLRRISARDNMKKEAIDNISKYWEN